MNTAHASTAAPVGDFSAWAFAAIHCTEPWMPLCSLHARARRGGSSLILLTCCAAVHRLQARRPPRPAKSQSSTPPTPQTAAATPSQDRVSAQNCTPCVCCSRGTARVHHTDRCRAEGAAADRLPSITLFPLPSSPMHSRPARLLTFKHTVRSQAGRWGRAIRASTPLTLPSSQAVSALRSRVRQPSARRTLPRRCVAVRCPGRFSTNPGPHLPVQCVDATLPTTHSVSLHPDFYCCCCCSTLYSPVTKRPPSSCPHCGVLPPPSTPLDYHANEPALCDGLSDKPVRKTVRHYTTGHQCERRHVRGQRHGLQHGGGQRDVNFV